MRSIRETLGILAVLTVLCGVAYPLALTALARAAFPVQSEGSLIRAGTGIAGSRLIGQPFANPGYLWPRPSATQEHPYNATRSGGSNLGPLHPALAAAARERVARLREQLGAVPSAPVPIDLVTASASGLDPHVSPAAAFYQVGRIAAFRREAPADIRAVMERHLDRRSFGLLGAPRVHVLLVNLELDERFGPPPRAAGRNGNRASIDMER